jgi:hypothetical protein
MTEPQAIATLDTLPKRERPTMPTAVDPNATPMQMLAIMTQRGVSMADLKELVVMAKDWEAREARKQFSIAFAAFKAEAVSVIRNKTVTDGPLKGKSYAELFAVVDAVAPALSKHGLSHAWKVTKDEKDWIEVTCFITHVAGHSESVSFGGPPDTGGAKNPIQARASTKTYLEKYTLLSVLGLSSKDADTDGAQPYQRVSEEQVANLQALIDEVGANKIQFLRYLKVNKLSDIAAAAYKDCVRLLEDKRKK